MFDPSKFRFRNPIGWIVEPILFFVEPWGTDPVGLVCHTSLTALPTTTAVQPYQMEVAQVICSHRQFKAILVEAQNWTVLLVPSCKLTNRHGKSTILMVFTRKDGDFHGRTVSLPEGRFWKYAPSMFSPNIRMYWSLHVHKVYSCCLLFLPLVFARISSECHTMSNN